MCKAPDMTVMETLRYTLHKQGRNGRDSVMITSR
jgi:hypothetical protein